MRCKEEPAIHDSLFETLTQIHLSMEQFKLVDASVHVLHLSWDYDLWPWARVVGQEHVADASDICPCPIHSGHSETAPAAKATAATAKPTAKGKAKPRPKAKGKAQARTGPMAKRAKPDDVSKRLQRELALVLELSLQTPSPDSGKEDDENVAPVQDEPSILSTRV